uniref:Uncharacterized protein n=1 Tax=Cairina moschata TaxID=8855 RepID=A0A8C3CCA2_CAIMO
MEDTSVSGLDNSKLEAIAHEIYTELVEDACLGLCFEVYHGVKCIPYAAGSALLHRDPRPQTGITAHPHPLSSPESPAKPVKVLEHL